jgi:putative transposase
VGGAELAPAGTMSRPHRLDGVDYVGFQRYFVTCCVLDRRPVFTDADVVAAVLSHFLQQATEFACAMFAYCVMPDHVHLLIEGTEEDADLKSFVARAKQKSGFDFAARRKHRLWQKGFYDRLLRDDESTTDVTRYIIANPVRAGLVVEPSEYPFWGSGVHTRDALIELLAVETRRR